MRVLITARSEFPLPPEQIPVLVQGFAAWRERYRDRMEAFYFLAAGGGGGGIFNVQSEEELSQMFIEWPFTPFVHVEATPIVDGDVTLQQWQGAAQMMMSQSGQG